jgi:hypothetical protein
MSWLDALSGSRPGPRPVPGGNRDGGPAVGGRREGRAGDDFNERAGWADILLPLGAVLHHASGGVRYWTRPGKDRRDGHSATTGYADDADRLKVFTPHWPPFADASPHRSAPTFAQPRRGPPGRRAEIRLCYGRQPCRRRAGSARNQPPGLAASGGLVQATAAAPPRRGEDQRTAASRRDRLAPPGARSTARRRTRVSLELSGTALWAPDADGHVA